MAPKEITEEAELYSYVNGFSEVYLVVGFSEKAQFADVPGAVKALHPYMSAAQERSKGQPFLCVYGGDPAHVDTIGKVMKQVKEAYGCHILAIQAAGKHEDWTDAVFITEQQYEVVRKVKDGKEVEVKEVLYGGTRDGKPVGGARYYMGEHFYGRPKEGVKGVVTLSIFLGGGAIAADELQYCDSLGAPWVFIPCKAKNFLAYNSTFGPLHEWAVKRLAEGKPEVALQGNFSQST